MERLAGKVALITGTRGIAKATAEAFASEGAAIIFATHTGSKQKRVDELVASVGSIGKTEIIPIACDITNPEARQQLAEEIQVRAGRLDILYHNAAGGFGNDDPRAADRINADAKVKLTETMAKLLATSQKPMVLNIESPWSEYWGTDIAGIEAYNPVAQSKYRGKVELPQAIRKLNQQLGTNIKYATVCATGVEGTITWRILEGRFKEQIQTMLDASEGGRATDTATVAQALLKLAIVDFPFGYTEYVGIPHWDEEGVKRRLSMYDDHSRKIDKIVFAQPDLAFGHYSIRKPDMHLASSVEKLEIDPPLDLTMPDAALIADDKDIEGHFAGEENPKIVPLWKLVAAVFESAKSVYRRITDNDYYIEAVQNMVAKRMVLPGDHIKIYLKPRLVGEAGYSIIDLGVELKVDGTIVDTIDTVTIRQGHDPNDHLKPLVLEAAALASGLDALYKNPGENKLPLFRRVESIKYADPEEFGDVLGAGTELVTQSHLDSNTPNAFVAQAITRIGLKQFAKTQGIECGLEERERVIALYNAFALRRQNQRERRAEKIGS